MCRPEPTVCMMKQPLHDCGFAVGRAGCTRRWRCCGRRLSQVQRGAPRDEDTIFAQETLKRPVEFNLKCVQLNYHRRTVHGRVDFHLLQSCSLTNISSAAPPPPPQVPLACLFPWQHIIRQNQARYAGIKKQLWQANNKKKYTYLHSVKSTVSQQQANLDGKLMQTFKVSL